MATASKSHHDMKIVEAKFDTIGSDLGDRMYVLVTLEDDSKRCLLNVPVGRVHLERRDLVGRTFAAAHAQAMCWLEAADGGIHRIVGIEKIGPIAEDDPNRGNVNGNWEVVARMSDGTSVRAFAFYNDELSVTEDDFVDLSLAQARELKFQRDREKGWNGLLRPDYSNVFANGRDATGGALCLLCGKSH